MVDTQVQPMTIEVSPEDIIRGLGALQNVPAVSGIVQAIKNSLADADVEIQIEIQVEGK